MIGGYAYPDNAPLIAPTPAIIKYAFPLKAILIPIRVFKMKSIINLCNYYSYIGE